MSSLWCAYTGHYYDQLEFNREHVLPLTLGGTDNFAIRANKKENARLGTLLDQQFANLPLISHARRYYELTGHRKIKPKTKWTGNVFGLEGTVDFSGEKITFTSYRKENKHGINLSLPLLHQQELTSSLAFDLNLICSYGAKLALGSGWLLYRDVFREYGYHEELRTLMNSSNADEILTAKNKMYCLTQKPNGFWGLNWPRSLGNHIGEAWCEPICKQQDKHLIWTLLNANEVVMCVSLFSGLFRWYFNISSSPRHFLYKDPLYDLGCVLEIDLKTKTVRRQSLREHLQEFHRKLTHIE